MGRSLSGRAIGLGFVLLSAGAFGTAHPAASPSGSANWHQYHYSPDLRGVNPLETVLSPSTVGGLHQIWAFPTTAPIQSSPAVVNGVLYVGGFDHNVYAIDASTGEEIWSVDTGRQVQSSPAVAYGRVFVQKEDGNFVALDAETGALAWEVTTGGLTGSPTVSDGVVYQEGYYDVRAYVAATGTRLWTADLPVEPYSPASVSQGTLFLVANTKAYGIDASSGAINWSTDTPNAFVSSAPAIANGLVYASKAYTGRVYAFRPASGGVVWRSSRLAGVLDSSPAVSDTTLYLGNNETNQLFAIDARFGTVVWFASGGGGTGGVVLANGVVYSGSHDGSLYAFDAASGAVLWKSPPTGGVIASSPVVVNGVVYVGSDDGTLYAFGL
jgi:eukaryotic-like serine/threonine-protein kinase